MPTVTLTLTDTPTGGVAIRSDFVPAVGNPITPAQSAALDIIARTRKEWGIPAPVEAQGGPVGLQGSDA